MKRHKITKEEVKVPGADPEGLPPGGQKFDYGRGGNGGSGVSPEKILGFACFLVASESTGISHLLHIILGKNNAW